MKLEKEIKILDIDVEKTQEALEQFGATFVNKKDQKIFVYDLPTMYHRYLEICCLLKSDNELMVATNIGKLEILLEEVEDLITKDEVATICQMFALDSITSIGKMRKGEILRILESSEFEKMMKKLTINPNKWIRLRESNGKVELTTKHVFDKKQTAMQQVMEREVTTSSFFETNSILESIGVVKRSYQEKIRFSYTYKTAEIELDIWPMLAPYMEIECDDESVMEEIINGLQLSDHEIVSMNTEQLYKRIGMDIKKMSELKF